MATTWHAFGKILASEADDLLRNSGVNGVFLSPKSTDGGPASNYKVVWTEVDCLQKALTIARAQSMIYGIVRGKSNFGYRVKALKYTQARQTLEPTWEKDNIHYDILIKERYVMTPLPLDVDKAMLQTILDRMQWKAMPLKQLGPSTWMVGAETPPTSDTASFRQELVLITKEMPKQSSKQPDTAVVAAPQAIRKTLDRQLKHAVSWACHGYDGNPVAHSYYGYSNWYLLEYPGDRLIRSYITRAYDIEQVDKEYLPAFSSCYFSKATARFYIHYSCITWDVYPVLPGLEVSHCWYVSFRFGEALHPGPPSKIVGPSSFAI